MTARSRGPRLAVAPLAALLAACAASPPPTAPPPDVALPERFGTEPGGSGAVRCDWWTTFGDERLDALVRAGLAHNHDLRAALARLEQAAATHRVAASERWPTADAGLDAQRARRLFLGFPFGGGGVPSSTTTTFGLSLSVRWELDLWGRVRSGESAALADVQAATADHAAAQLSLVGQICRAWFAAIEARAQLALAEATVRTFRGTADDVRDRYRRGVRPALDVHLAETDLANAQASVAERRERVQRAQRVLDVLVGRYPHGDAATPAGLPRELPALPAALPGELLRRRPDLAAAERRLAAAGARTDAARAALYPRLALTGSGGTTSEELEDLVDEDFRVWSIGANLLAPLFRGGALRADVARNEARAAEAAAAYGGIVLRAFAEVENVLAAEADLRARHEAIARAADHATRARDLARQRYQAGLTDFLAVADTQRQAFTADAAALTLARTRLENRIDLFLALGGGYAQDDPGAITP
jgi:NodT family efflux transporter outer membrane factor (OMF) lipoprotein